MELNSNNELMASVCDCGYRQREIERNRSEYSKIPEVYRDSRLKDLSTEKYEKQESKKVFIMACRIIKYWLEHPDYDIYIYSGCKGTGKTLVASCIANEMLERGKRVRFVAAPQIANEIRRSWNENGISENDVIHELVETDVLVIDDFGAEGIKTITGLADRYYNIINQRYEKNKLTIYTSNMSMDDATYDERIMDRIRERALPVLFPDESVRQNIAMKNKEKILRIIRGEEDGVQENKCHSI